MIKLMQFITLFLGLAGSTAAATTTGPLAEPLKVASIYHTTGPAVYVSFPAGTMPQCYNNSGGYLWKSHPNFDQLYAQILTMIGTGGIRGHVIFDTINPNAGQWDDCNILGFYLKPE
ncbi:hypothetical protein [Parasphingorhabdus sp.]|uniref:hypothetical protein n=1 Tax=Parasphingorhabdus sp. TaxID=2709688 RepID=UPI003262CFE4